MMRSVRFEMDMLSKGQQREHVRFALVLIFIIAFMLAAGISNGAYADAQDVYWNYDENSNTLTINSDISGERFSVDEQSYYDAPWLDEYRDSVQTVEVNDIAPGNMIGWFSGMNNLIRVHFNNVDTSNVQSMESLFRHAKNLYGVDLTSFDTSKVTSMKDMFSECYAIDRILLPEGFGKSAADMSGMFSQCLHLRTIYAAPGADWETQSQAAVHQDEWMMFDQCVKLEGGKGTTYSGRGLSYARIDGGDDAPGYFTEKKSDEDEKRRNTLKASGKTVKIKYSTLKKKDVKIARRKAIKVSDPKGKVTYKKISLDKKKYFKKFKVSSKGVITVKKGVKKGTYKLKIAVTAAGSKEYKKKTKNVTVKIKVK